jgi:5-oxoprolinase (ATP-hydrolysing) subunit A
MICIDLNCDMGESFGIYRLGYDEEAMPFITSANIACGFHASDPMTMKKTVQLAKKYGVAIGAHPSYPDLIGFGRRIMDISVEEIKADMLYQIGALWSFCHSEGVRMQHVKVHGALYNVAAKDITVATAIAETIKSINSGLFMVCLSNSAMVDAAKATGTKYVEEIFADRAYTSHGLLVARSQEGAVIHDPDKVAERALRMVRDKIIVAIDGTEFTVKAQTICVHCDTPGAVKMVRSIRQRLEQENISFQTFGR